MGGSTDSSRAPLCHCCAARVFMMQEVTVEHGVPAYWDPLLTTINEVLPDAHFHHYSMVIWCLVEELIC